jgi:glycosyltransferase involved in cell wall biosynthesis
MARVLFHISNALGPEQKIGGAEMAVLTVMKGLKREGWEPHVVMHDEGILAAQLDEQGIPWRVFRLNNVLGSISRNQRPSLKQIFAAGAGFGTLTSQLCELIRKWNISLVHANHMYSYLSSGIAARLCRIPCVWHLHESWEPGPVSYTFTRLGPLLADHVITIAEFETKTAAKLVGRVGYTLIPNAFDFDEMEAARRRSAEDVRAEFGIAPGQVLFGYVSHLAPYKGQRTFLRAFATLSRDYPQCRALIVGGPRKHCEWFRDDLIQEARKLAIMDRITFTGVRLDVADIINALDIFVCVSENQEFNRVLVEAMYFAKPVLATDLRGGSIVVRTRQTGMLVPPHDIIAMTRAMDCLVIDPELRARLGSNARRYVLATFPYRKIVPKYLEVYSQLPKRA